MAEASPEMPPGMPGPPSPSPPPSRPAFLDIERSVTGKRWEDRLADSRLALALSQQLDEPELIGRLLAARGIGLEAAPAFLEPRLKQAMPDPSVLRDMDLAAGRIADAVEADEQVAVFGDYDVDGATSSALLTRFFRALGRSLRVYIPDRIREGYGPNAAAFAQLKGEGVSLIITVDCGISAFEVLEEAAGLGLSTIVVDHHLAEARLPSAAAVINPNRLDDESGLGKLAAVGVTFLLVVAVNRELRRRGYYDKGGAAGENQAPDLFSLLDLVALGTVCDVVPLVGLNRAFVAQGLKVLADRGNVGLAALCDVAGVREAPESYHAGFLLGPRINAGGRVGEAPLGARLLALEDPVEAREIAARLDDYNRQRGAIERVVQEAAIEKVEAEDLARDSLLLVAGEGWHPGVIGIVASRLKDRYNRPTFVISLDGGIGKGSGRSLAGIDLGAAVTAARQADLLINGGGHPMAAGVTLAAEKLGRLKAFLSDHVARQAGGAAFQARLGFDGVLQPGAATAALLERLDRCGPFGVGNAQPRFAIAEAVIERADVVGQDHVRCRIRGADGRRLKGIAFRALQSPLGEALLQSGGLALHIAGKLKRDSWSGDDAVQFIIEDAAARAK